MLEARVASLGVSPYRTQSSDTSPRAERVLFELYRRMEPWQRLRIAFDLQQTVEDAARVGIRERRPGCSEREELLRLRALSYPRELMVRAFGWDPEVEGY